MMTLPSIRAVNVFFFGACVFLIISALLLQHYLAMEPCALCITQRICVIFCGVVALVAALHNPTVNGNRVYAFLLLVGAAAGEFFAGRHVWLQSLPEEQVPACGPALEYMFENFPITQAFKLLLMGDGNCAKVDMFMGLSVPMWTLFAFAGLLFVALVQLLRRN